MDQEFKYFWTKNLRKAKLYNLDKDDRCEEFVQFIRFYIPPFKQLQYFKNNINVNKEAITITHARYYGAKFEFSNLEISK